MIAYLLQTAVKSGLAIHLERGEALIGHPAANHRIRRPGRHQLIRARHRLQAHRITRAAQERAVVHLRARRVLKHAERPALRRPAHVRLLDVQALARVVEAPSESDAGGGESFYAAADADRFVTRYPVDTGLAGPAHRGVLHGEVDGGRRCSSFALAVDGEAAVGAGVGTGEALKDQGLTADDDALSDVLLQLHVLENGELY